MTQRGYDFVTTPGIDQIANEGVTFTRAYTPFPVCRSFRKSMMTGIMPSKISDATQHPSLGLTLKNAGYETIYHGKWHVGNTKINTSADWHGFDTHDGRQRDTSTRERAIDFIRQPHDKPFFMITSFMNPHDACELARNMSGIEDDYKDGPVEENMAIEFTPPLPANFEIPENEAEGFSSRRNAKRGSKMFEKHPTQDWSKDRWRQYLYGYDRLVEKVDAHIKMMIDELDAQGLLDNTVIIYTSDHGDGHAGHKWNQKMTFYEEAINIPFIISWKGKTKAGILDDQTLISNALDIYPTILKLAGVPVPDSLMGLDLAPQVMTDTDEAIFSQREYVVSELTQATNKGGTFTSKNGNKGRMVVTKDFKYILFEGGKNREQLFDLKNDPGEMRPVTYQWIYREQLIRHRNMLLEWDKRISDDDFSPIGKFPDIASISGE